MPESRNYEKELKMIMFSLADSIEEASDEEVMEDIKCQGKDPDVVAKEVRDILLASVKAYRKRKFAEAKERYKMRVKKVETGLFALPATPQERRDLLLIVVNDNPYMAKGLLTAQYRDFKDLSDDDVESMLKQLQQLGVLKDPNSKEK